MRGGLILGAAEEMEGMDALQHPDKVLVLLSALL